MANPGRRRSQIWRALLAGGNGSRLRALATKIEGDARPKQFCRVLGNQTLLTQTRRRISPVVRPDKVVAVVNRAHEPFYAAELGDLREGAMVAQPENRGTGDTIAFFPCDHYYHDEPAFWMRSARAFGRRLTTGRGSSS